MARKFKDRQIFWRIPLQRESSVLIIAEDGTVEAELLMLQMQGYENTIQSEYWFGID